MKQQSINSIIGGAVQRPKKLREIAKALQTTEEYLLGEVERRNLREHHSARSFHQIMTEMSRCSSAPQPVCEAFPEMRVRKST